MADTIKQERNTAFYIKRIFGSILLLALAAVFFFSAFSKLDNIEPFEWTFIDLGIGSNMLASVIAHLFIGIELIIGIFLLFHIYLKQVTYPATIGLLVLLTGYLVMLIMQQGNTGNCGCFGNWLYMNPLQAIWKNLAMIAAVVLLIFIYPIKPYKNQEWIAAFLGMAGIVATFITAPLNVNNKPKAVNEAINLDPLYADPHNAPVVELRQGKHIIAFMSLTCPHCRKAAYMLHVLKEKNPSLPIYAVLSGHPDNLAPFFKETNATNLPYLLFKNTQAFTDMAGPGVPAIYWVNNGIKEYESTYLQLDPAAIKNWLNQ